MTDKFRPEVYFLLETFFKRKRCRIGNNAGLLTGLTFYEESARMAEHGGRAKTDDDQHAWLRHWVIDVFHLPETTVVTATEHDHADEAHTEVVVQLGSRVVNRYTLAKPLADVTRPDIEALRAAVEAGVLQKHPILGHLYRFFGLWFAFSGVYVLFSAQCPFCGQPGCPVSLGAAGVMGLIVSLCFQNWKGLFKTVYRRLMKRPAQEFVS